MYLVEDLGESSIVDVQVDDRLIKVRMPQRPAVKEGEAVHLSFADAALHLFDRDSGRRR